MSSAQDKVTWGEKIGYAIGPFGKSMSYTLVSSFFMFYCTDTLGVSVAFMGMLFMVARIWDAINDPMMGTIVDNTRNKFGKYRTWILVGTLINVVIFIVMFYRPEALSDTTLKVYIAVMYILWGMSFTLCDVPYWSFLTIIARDPKDRDIVSTLPRIVAGAGSLVISLFGYRLVSTVLGTDTPNSGWFRLAIIIAIVFVVFMCITVFTINEYTIVKQDKKFSFVDAFRTLKNNDQLLIIVVVLILVNIVITMTTSTAIYYFKYVWYNTNLYGTFTTIVSISTTVGLVGYPLIARKIERKKLFNISILLPIVGFIVMFILSFIIDTDNATTLSFILFCIPALICCCGFGVVTVMTSVMLADTVEYGEWKLGYRSESIIFSMQTFMTKFGAAIAAILLSVGLKIGGYVEFASDSVTADPNGEAAALLQDALNAQTNLSGVQNALTILMFIVPPVLLFISLLVFRKYNLFQTKMDGIRAELEVIRAEKNALADAAVAETAETADVADSASSPADTE